MRIASSDLQEVSPLCGFEESDFFLISTTEKENFEYNAVIVGVIFFLLVMGVFVAVSFVVFGTVHDDGSTDDGGGVEGVGSDREGMDGAYSGSDATSIDHSGFRSGHGRLAVPQPRLRSNPPLENITTLRPVLPVSTGGDQVAARLIKAFLNKKHSPCNDFYGFVCGNYSGSQAYVLTMKLRAGSKNMLAKLHVPASNQRAVEKAAGLFQACKRLGSGARRSEVRALRSFLSQLGLDLSDMPDDPNFDVADRITRLSLEYGFPAFVKIGYFNRPHLPYKILEPFVKEHALLIGKPENENKKEVSGRGLAPQMLIYDEDDQWISTNRASYDTNGLARYYRQLLRLYDTKLDDTAVVARIIRGEYLVGREIQNALKGSKSHSTFVNRLGTLTRNYVSQGRWEELIRRYTKDLFAGADVVVVWNGATKLVVLLMDKDRLAREDSRLLIAWSLVHRLLPLVHGQSMITVAQSRFFKQPDHIGEFCFQVIQGIMSLPIAKHFLRKAVPPSALEGARQVAMNIKESLFNQLRNSSWIKEPVWSLMFGKGKNMRVIIAHPKELATDTLVEAFFAAFPNVGRDFFTPYVESHRLLTTRVFTKNATENFTNVVANAFYRDSENKVAVLLGILQPPFFINGAAAAFNYGALGQVVGHEIMHGFDALGITYSYKFIQHNFRYTPTMQKYKEKLLCLRSSYLRAEAASRARTLSHKIDSEGFADFAGLLLALAAYRSLSDHLRKRVVPDVGLSADQTFFVSHCLKWCNTEEQTHRDPRSLYWPSRSRCIVPLQNMPEFAEAFYCKRGDFMNPPDKCSFW